MSPATKTILLCRRAVGFLSINVALTLITGAADDNTRGTTPGRWSAPFATRLDVDTLEDLVEGAGGFVTDRRVQ